MYEGEYHSTIDDKGRLALPINFRRLMEELGHLIWYITRGFDHTLFLFSESSWQELSSAIPADSINPKHLDFRRYLIGSSAKVQMDNAGRLLIPQHLRNFADIERSAVLLGLGGHLELWNDLRWKQFCQQHVEDYKKMAAEVFGTSGSEAIQPKEESTDATSCAG